LSDGIAMKDIIIPVGDFLIMAISYSRVSLSKIEIKIV